ncbi:MULTISPECIES: universal stress protein [Oceanibaculum]|uniref:Nucleotide-binding universal stress UspA family protein n=1 Tax=Oceanibaculum indicum TaxID=526216 RepID=A0A420WGC6_9PROT|nr:MULTISPECIES: universal stress protein [Oceanibaculum]MCH2394177.1 universal stress protein [Oceanibaculum sp.]RKQ70050.1 nucleotide-binding universal stress UspA family protein [Oceanibaculum indicum]
MYKNILVPIDLTQAEKGTAMLAVAAKLADQGAKITAINVVEDLPGYVRAELPTGLVEKNLKAAQEEMAKLVKDSGVAASVQVSDGNPSREILDHASKIGADLIIVASHRPGMQDYFLGSTAARVVRHAACSVLVTR